ncbi:recombinase family protein [Thomasclavelia sp.]|uniref:recombinase family protein n=1 Tax=Thomasclavelia sp. TaxID=3025757 RepID=UPI0025D48FD9|nr:recombinase family protein [Thomasclavelia sp.]
MNNVNNYLMYLRKSRADSPEETVEEVLAKHEKQLQDHAIRLFGSKIPENNIFREVVSGETIEDRPEIKQILAKIEDPQIKGLFVIEVQRLSRGDWEDGGKILTSFKYSNTLVITPSKTYDLNNKFDYKFFKMELSQGNDYLEYTKEILNRGKYASVKEGNYIGSIAPFGYDKIFIDKSPTLAPNATEAPAIQLIFNCYVNEGIGWTKIARKLDNLGIKPRKSEFWNPVQIKTILTNPVYIGKIQWNHRKTVKIYEDGKIKATRPVAKDFEIFEGKHPALISDDLFYKAQDKLGKNTREPFSKEIINPLAGLLYCKKCGKAMTYRTYKSKEGYYRSAPRLACTNQIHCGTKSATFEEIYQAVITILETVIKDFEVKIKNGDTTIYEIKKKMIINLEKDLEKLEDRQEELYDLLEDHIYTKEIFTLRNEKLGKEREELQKKIKAAKEDMPAFTLEEKVIQFKDVLKALKDPTVSAKTKNMLLKTIITSIEYSRDSKNRTKWDISKPMLDIHLKDF